MEIARFAELYQSVSDEISRVVVGQPDVVDGALVALFSGGSVLIEGPPGLGKTLLVNVLARVTSCDFKRVQFTPDLMPADLVGHNIYDMGAREFRFSPGPIFTNLLLADEINRSPAKTQSALLEVMQEHQVTVDGKTYPLDPPFMTLATQNPLEHEGTYPLPEAQIDRFIFKLLIDYPVQSDENAILDLHAGGRKPQDLESFDLRRVITAADVIDMQRTADRVIVEPEVTNYITSITGRTRTWDTISIGASPRASIGMLTASRALAAAQSRDFVIPDDVKEVAPGVLRHRLRLNPEAEIEGLTPDEVIVSVLDAVEVPQQ